MAQRRQVIADTSRHVPPRRSLSCVFSGDLSHLVSIFILLRKIQITRSCRGLSRPPSLHAPSPLAAPTDAPSLLPLPIASPSFCLLSWTPPGLSFKTQALYVVVFLLRYLDLLTLTSISAYNTLMKLFFIGSSIYTLYLMKFKYR